MAASTQLKFLINRSAGQAGDEIGWHRSVIIPRDSERSGMKEPDPTGTVPLNFPGEGLFS